MNSHVYIFNDFRAFTSPGKCRLVRPQLRMCSIDKLTPVTAAVNTLHFLPCDAMHKRGYCRHAVFVRPSVCLSRS